MLENHMVITTPTPPSLQPEREETCVICEKTACLTADGWYTHCAIEDDGQEPAYIVGDGDELTDATDTDSGWVCSRVCRSQAMFNRLSDGEKDSLRRVRDACVVLIEHGREAIASVQDGMEEWPADLVESAKSFLDDIADDGNEMPEWCNQPTREDRLGVAVLEAQRSTRDLAMALGIETQCRLTDGHTWDWQAVQHARHAATAARISEDLKEAQSA